MAAGVAVLTHFFRLSLKQLFPNSKNSFLVDRGPYGVPLPAVRHKTVTKEELGGRNLLIVGDVHGCFDEMVELLEKCHSIDPDACTIFVGDLVNKGPKSLEVIRRVRELDAYCIRGNHDEVCMMCWQQHCEGGTPLLKEMEWMKQLTREELAWFSELPYSIHIPSHKILVVHAGLVPGVQLEDQNPDDLLHLRDLKRDSTGSKWTPIRKGSRDQEGGERVPWASVWPGPEHVYFGHDALRLYQSYEFATGLDTGCVYGRKLTAMFPLMGRRVVEVAARSVHSPPTKTPPPAN